MTKIKVKLNEVEPEPTELIAQSIIEISDAFKKINSGMLNRRALVLLLQDATGLPQRSINQVLNSLAELKELYLKK